MSVAQAMSTAQAQEQVSSRRRTTAGGRKAGNKNFSSVELEAFLYTMESILPIGPIEWENVLQQHEQRFADKDRTVESLRRKYLAMVRVKTPTVDPNIPPLVLKAKRIFREIETKSEGFEELHENVLGFEENTTTLIQTNEPTNEPDTDALVLESMDNNNTDVVPPAPTPSAPTPSVMASTPRQRFSSTRNTTQSNTGGGVMEMLMATLASQMQQQASQNLERERRWMEEKEERDRRWEAEREERRFFYKMMMDKETKEHKESKDK
jgi:hypothetical protein